ncbi:MAG: hypothetical protein ABJA37_14205, partial [Ferruginibacter sp.]
MWDSENNMDELFRKAAKYYPLKKAADGWDQIAPLLKNDAPGKAVVKSDTGKKRNNSILMLLIVALLFLALVTKDGLNVWPSVGYPGHKNEKSSSTENVINIAAKDISGIYKKKSAQKILPANAAIYVPGYNKYENDPGSSGFKSKGNNGNRLFTNPVFENTTKMTGIAV